MIGRRGFIGGVLRLALRSRSALMSSDGFAASDDTVLRQYLVDVAACDVNILGVPSNGSLVEKGLHPVAPDRVIVVDNDELRRFNIGRRELKRRLRHMEDHWRTRFPDAAPPGGKLDVVVGLMDRLTSHYRRPDLLEKWSRVLWRRELLGSTGIGCGRGLLHDFQPYDTAVCTDNGVVDWWLVLFPGGLNWQALDDRPVYFMVGPVMEKCQPGPYLRVMEGISRGLRPLIKSEGFDPAAWANRLAGITAEEAARALNYAAAQGLCGGKRIGTYSHGSQ